MKICQSAAKNIKCDTTYPDHFKITTVRGSDLHTRTECLSHAANSEKRGEMVTLIDMR